MEEIYMKDLIGRYLRNECNRQEFLALLHYIRSNEGKQMLHEIMDEESERVFLSDLETDPAISDRIFDRLEQSMSGENIQEESAVRTVFPWLNWRVAASFIGFLLVVGLGYRFLYQKQTEVVMTGNGQKRTVILPDGSRVIMNANSSVTYSRDFDNENTRKIHLDGEAFFDVAHDSARPFFVETSKIEIKVLGTAFNVKAYGSDKTVETTLMRGRVTIKNIEEKKSAKNEMVLLPNERAVFSKASSTVSKGKVVPDESQTWHKGHLVFEDEPFQVIVQELEKWYHVKIDVAEEKSKNCRFSLNIEGESLPEVLRLFETTTGVVSEVRGKEVSLKGNLCE